MHCCRYQGQQQVFPLLSRNNSIKVSFIWDCCSYAPSVSRIQFSGVCEFRDPCTRISLFIRSQCAGVCESEDPCTSFLRLLYLMCGGLWRWSKMTRRMNLLSLR